MLRQLLNNFKMLSTNWLMQIKFMSLAHQFRIMGFVSRHPVLKFEGCYWATPHKAKSTTLKQIYTQDRYHYLLLPLLAAYCTILESWSLGMRMSKTIHTVNEERWNQRKFVKLLQLRVLRVFVAAYCLTDIQYCRSRWHNDIEASVWLPCTEF